MVTNLDQIKVSGADGKAPTIEGAWPLAIAKTQSKVLKQGSGETVGKDATVKVNYHGVNGRTGKVFDSSFQRGSTADFPLSQVVPGFAKGLVGKHAGDRVLIMMPGSDAYDPQGGRPEAGIMKGDSLVFVVDVVGVPLTKAKGAAVTPASGLPTVKEVQGAPVVTIGNAKKPSGLVVQPLIKGDGHKITAKDAIDVKYRTYAWSTKELIEDGFSGPALSGSMNSVIPGWKKGLEGQTVGSRVMLIVPPADAYPNGTTNPPVKKGETLVYVIDILSAQKES
ncbi:FKBP-type peptidyl-prolyl cis-trans isomerase [Cutibacterium equinum]|uniref:Peptidyl-prolyl cis-trans isomerase n=2 Tax=Cutibacterium equinum TaxID=3016342 RepID=A0ABY7R1C8_9ACTN|nr:FKBP-type peptidyl-prolyl cis-trans isomerase [Cutibacterium equinum]WCC81111.1 FKBP-type peptidyl-prolyl cis-trans isomerase [Cutibacterium equinum]